MNVSFNHFKNTNNEIFVKLKNVLLVPFGIDYVYEGNIPVQMETCYSDGVILKYNVPCATIDTSKNEPIRVRDIVRLLPDVDILPLSHERFKLKNPQNRIQENGRVAKKYLDYLVDIYKENTGEYKGGNIQYNNKFKLSEEAFIDIYFEVCCQQIKDAEKQFWTEGVRKQAEEIFEEYEREKWNSGGRTVEDWEDEIGYGFGGYTCTGLKFPFNDGRVLFEILLPLHSARMSFPTSDIGNTMRQYKVSQSVFDQTIDNGVIDDQELVPKWSAINPGINLRNQSNKNRVSFYELDFLFWDGQQFICIELDGNQKLLSKYSAKKENLEKCNNLILKSLTNENLKWLINHFNAESSPDLEYRTETLSILFSQNILKFWETVNDDSPITKLFNEQEWDSNNDHVYGDEFSSGPSFWILKNKLDKEVYPNLPWHLRYTDGYVYFDDPTE